MKRREFITLVGGGAVWPVVLRAQQAEMPVVGFVHGGSAAGYVPFINAFRQGLRQIGFIEGSNVAIEFRWADNQRERISGYVGELVRRPVNVIVVGGGDIGVSEAMALTSSIPIVGTFGRDPVEAGLVSNFNRPGKNVTGISVFAVQLVAKRLELAREFVAGSQIVGFLQDPANSNSLVDGPEVAQAAAKLGQAIAVEKATTQAECIAAFESFARQAAKAVIVQSDPFFNSVVQQLVALSLRHVIPTVFPRREFVVAGGLMSYGSSLPEAYRQLGIYTGRVLKGDRPGDLPIVLPTRYELVVNLATAKVLGIDMPTPVLLRADEVIE